MVEGEGEAEVSAEAEVEAEVVVTTVTTTREDEGEINGETLGTIQEKISTETLGNKISEVNVKITGEIGNSMIPLEKMKQKMRKAELSS